MADETRCEPWALTAAVSPYLRGEGRRWPLAHLGTPHTSTRPPCRPAPRLWACVSAHPCPVMQVTARHVWRLPGDRLGRSRGGLRGSVGKASSALPFSHAPDEAPVAGGPRPQGRGAEARAGGPRPGRGQAGLSGSKGQAGSALDGVHLTECVVQDGVLPLEPEVASELLSLKQQREPVAVVWPHVREGDLVQPEPLRAHLCRG